MILNWIYLANMEKVSFDKAIEFLNEIVIKALAEEFESAGHKMTGKLIDDIETQTEENADGFVQDYLIYKYGMYLSDGVPANRIPFSPGSGAGKSLYIEGLIRYVQQRKGISDLKKAKSIAFAIAHTQIKTGMPIRTKGAGTGWITKAITKMEERVPELFGDYNERMVIANIDELTQKWSKQLST